MVLNSVFKEKNRIRNEMEEMVTLRQDHPVKLYTERVGTVREMPQSCQRRQTPDAY